MQLSKDQMICIAIVVVVLIAAYWMFSGKTNLERFQEIHEDLKQTMQKLDSSSTNLGADLPASTGTCLLTADVNTIKSDIDNLMNNARAELNSVASAMGATITQTGPLSVSTTSQDNDLKNAVARFNELGSSILSNFKSVMIGGSTVWSYKNMYACDKFCTAGNNTSLYKATYNSTLSNDKVTCICPVNSFPQLDSATRLIVCKPVLNVFNNFYTMSNTVDSKNNPLTAYVSKGVNYNCGFLGCNPSAAIQADGVDITNSTVTPTDTTWIKNRYNTHILCINPNNNNGQGGGVVAVFKGTTVPTNVDDGEARIVWKNSVVTSLIAGVNLKFIVGTTSGKLVQTEGTTEKWSSGNIAGGTKAVFENDGSLSIYRSDSPVPAGFIPQSGYTPTGSIGWNSSYIGGSYLWNDNTNAWNEFRAVGQIVQKITGRVFWTTRSGGDNWFVGTASTDNKLASESLFYMIPTQKPDATGEIVGRIVHAQSKRFLCAHNNDQNAGARLVLNSTAGTISIFRFTTAGQLIATANNLVINDSGELSKGLVLIQPPAINWTAPSDFTKTQFYFN